MIKKITTRLLLPALLSTLIIAHPTPAKADCGTELLAFPVILAGGVQLFSSMNNTGEILYTTVGSTATYGQVIGNIALPLTQFVTGISAIAYGFSSLTKKPTRTIK